MKNSDVCQQSNPIELFSHSSMILTSGILSVSTLLVHAMYPRLLLIVPNIVAPSLQRTMNPYNKLGIKVIYPTIYELKSFLTRNPKTLPKSSMSFLLPLECHHDHGSEFVFLEKMLDSYILCRPQSSHDLRVILKPTLSFLVSS